MSKKKLFRFDPTTGRLTKIDKRRLLKNGKKHRVIIGDNSYNILHLTSTKDD